MSQEDKDFKQEERLNREYPRVLKLFFKLDKSKIQALADAFTENGANISMATVSKITGLSISDASLVKGSMLFNAHNKVHHTSDFRSEMSYLDKDTIEKVVDFFEKKLSAKGLQELNKAYTALMNLPETLDVIDESGFKIDYQDIRDENNNLIGFMPLVRFRIKTYGNEGLNEFFFTSTAEAMRPMIDAFEEHRKEALEKIKKDRKTLGNMLVFAGDEET